MPLPPYLPFITGSHAYGEPDKDSDIDLVVLVTPETENALVGESELGKYPVRYGNINLIPVTTRKEYKAWKEATDQMKKLCRQTGCVFTPEKAAAIIDGFYDKYGILHRRVVSDSGPSTIPYKPDDDECPF